MVFLPFARRVVSCRVLGKGVCAVRLCEWGVGTFWGMKLWGSSGDPQLPARARANGYEVSHVKVQQHTYIHVL